MSKSQKVYFIICSIIVGLAVAVHITALVIFISSHFGAASQLAKALSLVLVGIIWFVVGGISTIVSLVTSIILIKVSKKWSLIFIITIVVLTVATFLCWYISVKTPQPEPETAQIFQSLFGLNSYLCK